MNALQLTLITDFGCFKSDNGIAVLSLVKFEMEGTIPGTGFRRSARPRKMMSIMAAEYQLAEHRKPVAQV